MHVDDSIKPLTRDNTWDSIVTTFMAAARAVGAAVISSDSKNHAQILAAQGINVSTANPILVAFSQSPRSQASEAELLAIAKLLNVGYGEQMVKYQECKYVRATMVPEELLFCQRLGNTPTVLLFIYIHAD